MTTGPSGQVSITAFFPAYNDGESLPTLIPRAIETLSEIAGDYEVIVIDDGSTDGTPEVLDRLQREHRSLRVIRHPRNLGYGAALCDGFRNATKELIFYTDGDGQYDVRELKNLLPLLSPGVDAVVGYKTRRADSKLRAAVGKLYGRLVRLLFRLCVRDVDCDFRLVRRSVVERLALGCHSGAICVELMRRIEMQGFRVVEAPVSHYPRPHGRSQFFRAGPIARTLFDVGRLWVQLVLLKRNPAARSLSHCS